MEIGEMRHFITILGCLGLGIACTFLLRESKSQHRASLPTQKKPQKRPSLTRVSSSPAAPVPVLNLDPLRKILAKSGQKWTKKLLEMGRLSGGGVFVGLPDGRKVHEGRFPGALVMFRDRQGQWLPFLKGTSIHSITIAKNDWSAVLTAKSALFLRTPEGKLQRLVDDAGLHPHFSKSGRYLLYVHRQSLAHHTLLRHEIGSGKQFALSSRGPVSNPVFGPNDKDVIYVSGRSGFVSLWKVTPEGKQTQLTNRGLQPGQGRKPKGFIPPPAGRHPVLWAGHWLLFDAGDSLWAIRDDGTDGRLLAKGAHRPTWHVPGKSALYSLQGKQYIVQLPR